MKREGMHRRKMQSMEEINRYYMVKGGKVRTKKEQKGKWRGNTDDAEGNGRE